jgi:hypothetical protein
MEKEKESSIERFKRLAKSENEWRKSYELYNYPIFPLTLEPEIYIPEKLIQKNSVLKENLSSCRSTYFIPESLQEISVGCSSILPLPEIIKDKIYDYVDPERMVDFEYVRKRAIYILIGVASSAGLGIGIAAATNYLNNLSK